MKKVHPALITWGGVKKGHKKKEDLLGGKGGLGAGPGKKKANTDQMTGHRIWRDTKRNPQGREGGNVTARGPLRTNSNCRIEKNEEKPGKRALLWLGPFSKPRKANDKKLKTSGLKTGEKRCKTTYSPRDGISLGRRQGGKGDQKSERKLCRQKCNDGIKRETKNLPASKKYPPEGKKGEKKNARFNREKRDHTGETREKGKTTHCI